MKKKNSLLMAVLLMFPFLPMACSDDDSGGTGGKDILEPIKVELNRATLTEGGAKSNRFAGNLLYTVASLPENTGRNICMSPISMQYLVSIIANGADDEARAQIAEALGMDNLDEINSNAQALMEKLQQDDQYVKVALANSVWIDCSLEARPAFAQNVATFYKGKVSTADFKGAPASASKAVDQWASESTGGIIKNVSLHIDNSTSAVLANAALFDGKWTYPFNAADTKLETFHCQDGTEQSVPTMHCDMTVKYALDGTTQAAELSYGKGYYSMVLLMPADADDIDRLFLDTDWWQLHDSMQEKTATVCLPKFKTVCHWTKLLEILPQLGMSKVPSNSMPNLFLKNPGVELAQACQDLSVEVSENGTRSAVVSSAEVGITAVLPSRVRFDHPFVYAIRENTTGTILFMGKVVKF